MTNNTTENHGETHDLFEQHLQRASETVRSWPNWKRSVLGATSTVPVVGLKGCNGHSVSGPSSTDSPKS